MPSRIATVFYLLLVAALLAQLPVLTPGFFGLDVAPWWCAVLTGTAIVAALALAIFGQRTTHDARSALHEGVASARVQSRSAVIQGMARLAESRDDQTGQHLDRIRGYVRILGESLVGAHPEVTPQFVETIVETSALHDIGKVGVPDHVLLKRGSLTDEEREIIKKHTLIGGDTLLAIRERWGSDEFIITACEIVFAHHERYDGTGYPFGLSGDVIPLATRIVAVADVYDALTSARAYKEAYSHDAALEIIESAAGTHFDPVVVRAFLTTAPRFAALLQRFREGHGPRDGAIVDNLSDRSAGERSRGS